jgi:hypothetical protein
VGKTVYNPNASDPPNPFDWTDAAGNFEKR